MVRDFYLSFRYYTLSQTCEGLPERWQTLRLNAYQFDPNAPYYSVRNTDKTYRDTACFDTYVINELYHAIKCTNLVETQQVPLDSCDLREYRGDDQMQVICNL